MLLCRPRDRAMVSYRQPSERALATVSNIFALAPTSRKEVVMHSIDKTAGIYTPEDLKKIAEEFNRGKVTGEDAHDREGRATAIFNRKEQDRSTPAG